MMDWLNVTRGEAPLIVSAPHAGLAIPAEFAGGFLSLDRARSDADFYIDRLYDFAPSLGATFVRTAICRTVVDVNRDPSGASLYPGQATTGLCPTTTFAGLPLYRDGREPSAGEIADRRARYFDPYHRALAAEIARLRRLHPRIVVYDAHSIRSHVPRLFEGDLAQFNIGTFDGASCSKALTDGVAAACESGNRVINGRFKGGWITRHYGAPAQAVHAIQMELAMKHYLDEDSPWPPPWDAQRASALQNTLRNVLASCLAFAKSDAH